MTRFLFPLAAASRRTLTGDHHKISSTSAGSQRDLVDGAVHCAAPTGRARLTNFRRAIKG